MTWTCVLSPCRLIQVLSYIFDGWKEESRKRPDAWRLRVQIDSCACCARLPGLLWKQNLKRKELPLQTCLNLPIYVGHLAMLLSGLPIQQGLNMCLDQSANKITKGSAWPISPAITQSGFYNFKTNSAERSQSHKSRVLRHLTFTRLGFTLRLSFPSPSFGSSWRFHSAASLQSQFRCTHIWWDASIFGRWSG
jgi:hypothetical protein